jgi:hypothetical protein
VPVSNEQAATPSKPPKSSVPGPDEESFGPKPSELPEPDFPAGEPAEEGQVDEHHREGDPEAHRAVILAEDFLGVVLHRILDDGFFDRISEGEEHLGNLALSGLLSTPKA